MGPVTKMPAGTTRCPPPCFCKALIAFWKAAVLSVTPSPTPPNSVRLIELSGITGNCGSAIFPATAAGRLR